MVLGRTIVGCKHQNNGAHPFWGMRPEEFPKFALPGKSIILMHKDKKLRSYQIATADFF